LSHVVPLRDGETVPEGIRFARSASAPLPLAVLKRFEETAGIPVVETYGMTEAASQIAANPVEGPRRPGSVGKPVGTDVRVAAPAGTVGGVFIRGAGVIDHYDSPGYDDRFDDEGWLDTGDLGRFDEEGWLYLVGRADDVVNCGGEKVYPREIEEVLLQDPGVAGAAVVGEEHQVLGQVPVAFVVAADAGPSGEAAEVLVRRLATRCEQQLSKHRRPVAYHVVAQLPQGTNGKLRRRDVGGEPVIYSLLIR
jgi:acyl-CoA synthetase (AMP-forming)/AMP-acid ligase II